jgi:hypothetical protein
MADGTRKSLWDTATAWNRRQWRRWVVTHLLFGGVPPRSSSAPPRASSPPESGTKPSFDAGPEAARPTTPAPGQMRPIGLPDLLSQVENRYDARSRLEALTDRFVAVEERLEAMHRRLALREQQERRSEARLTDLMERATETAERQSDVLRAVTAAQERIEQRLERIEQRLPRAGNRDSVGPPTIPSWDGVGTPPDPATASRWVRGTRTETAQQTEPPGHGSVPVAPAHPAFHGSLSDMSLPTLLAMFELERRTGRLTVALDFEEPIGFLLHRGKLAAASSFGAEIPAIDALRRTMRWSGGEFWFDPVHIDEPPGGARSIGALLMEASQQEDEAARTG